jgi:hypothetical protein
MVVRRDDVKTSADGIFLSRNLCASSRVTIKAWFDLVGCDGLFVALEDDGKVDVEENAGSARIDKRVREVDDGECAALHCDAVAFETQALLYALPL